MSSNCNPTTINNSDANHISSSSSLALKPSENLSLLFNQFNNYSPEPKNEPENVVNSNCYDIDQIQTLKFPVNLQSYSFEFTPTESNAGGTLLYIANDLYYKPPLTLT